MLNQWSLKKLQPFFSFKKGSNNKASHAFTLAEVLITLTIIGTIAALTIPVLIQSVQKDQYVTKLKKEYSVISQAFNELAQDAGGSIMDVPGFSSTTGSPADDATVVNEFATKLIGLRVCGNSMNCVYKSSVKFLNGSPWTSDLDTTYNNSLGKAILADGAMIMVNTYSGNCSTNPGGSGTGPLYQSVCGDIFIDVNGTTGPNQNGRDVFWLYITKTGIFPKGSYNDGTNCTNGNSDGCSAKILTEGAMNY